jgi:hypothetical protein
MMIEINYMATAAGSFYFLGLFLYYWHVHHSLNANKQRWSMMALKSMLVSIIWPYNVLEIIWNAILNRGDDA